MGMMAEVGTALTAHINGQTYSEEFTAVMRYAPQSDLDELEALTVMVVPATMEANTISRHAATYEIGIDIGIMQRLSNGEDCDLPAEVDGLMDLTEEVELSLRFQQFTMDDGSIAAWTRMERSQAFEQEHMMRNNVFTSTMRVFFKVIK